MPATPSPASAWPGLRPRPGPGLRRPLLGPHVGVGAVGLAEDPFVRAEVAAAHDTSDEPPSMTSNRPRSREFEAPVTGAGTRQRVDAPCNLRGVESSGDLRVSSRGQMSLPAAARTRWELTDGGEVGYLDLGDALLLVPGGVEALRRRVLGAVTDADWEAAASGFGDPDLASE